jgi:hypothetical protein
VSKVLHWVRTSSHRELDALYVRTPHLSPAPCCTAVDRNLYDFSPPSTILVPTDEAWKKVLSEAGLNTTDLQELSGIEHVVARGASLAIILYHELPDVTLTSANITDGQSFPTSLKGAGNITVHKTAGNISFVGYVNVTAGETPANNTAHVLYPDIRVNGTGVLLHIVDAVLAPPEEAFTETTEGLSVLIAALTGQLDGTDASGAGSGNATTPSASPAAGAANTTTPSGAGMDGHQHDAGNATTP